MMPELAYAATRVIGAMWRTTQEKARAIHDREAKIACFFETHQHVEYFVRVCHEAQTIENLPGWARELIAAHSPPQP